MHVRNTTPFPVTRFVCQDRTGRDRLVVVVKATYAFDGRGNPDITEEQLPVQLEDTFHGAPGASSPRLESDLAPFKPATDVVLIGHAYSPQPRSGFVDVQLEVGSLRRRCRVFGDRRWTRSVRGLHPSSPEEFERIPLVYERAFGGADGTPRRKADQAQEDRNPVGCGFLAEHSRLDASSIPVPNIEDPDRFLGHAGQRVPPAGFGFIGRHWEPRRSLAGTYDGAWSAERSPGLPDDFDDRYHNGAHPGLVYDGYLEGNESVSIQGASPDGPLRFRLPAITLGVRTVTADLTRVDLEPRLDTLVLEPDRRRFSLVWRAGRDVHGLLQKLAMIRVTADA